MIREGGYGRNARVSRASMVPLGRFLAFFLKKGGWAASAEFSFPPHLEAVGRSCVMHLSEPDMIREGG